jgi:hypothetical protein
MIRFAANYGSFSIEFPATQDPVKPCRRRRRYKVFVSMSVTAMLRKQSDGSLTPIKLFDNIRSLISLL